MKRHHIRAVFAFLALSMIGGSPAWSEGCAGHLDAVEKALDQSDLAADRLQPMRDDLEEAREASDAGDEDGCSAAAARLISAMLQTDGIDHQPICDRVQSESDIGEADMAGNQDVKSALQSSCSDRD